MRSGSTVRPSSASCSDHAAPPAPASAADRAPHSLCHAPAARSCSPAIASSSTPAAPRAERAAARARTAPTGLRLCAMADEPPRPPSLDSATSPTSFCASRTMSSATFSQAPAAIASAAASAATRVRSPCQGSGRLLELELGREPREHGRAEAGQRARRAAELHGERDGREAVPRGRDAGEPARGLEAERGRQRVLHQRPGRHRRASVLIGQPRAGAGHPVELSEDQHPRPPAPRASPRCRGCPGSSPRSERPAPARAAPARAARPGSRPPRASDRSNSPARHAAATASAAAGEITPSAACAAASAASASSIACTQARSDTVSCTASGTKIESKMAATIVRG